MTKRASRRAARTSFCLLAAFVLSCAISGSDRVLAFPQPEPLPSGFIYGDNFADDTESFMLLSRLKQLTEQKHRVDEQIEREIADEREITDEQFEIQAMLEAKARERANEARPDYSVEEPEPEPLPIPAAIVHHEQQPNKRHGTQNAVSYMSLCHFKICNMGRKRQSK